MVQLSTFGGVTVPSTSDAATIPADLLKIVNQFCGAIGVPARVNAVVTSKAERDANYDGYPAGGLIICPSLKTVWLSLGKTGNIQGWTPIYSDTGWITDGFTMGDQWTPYSTGSVRVRRTTNLYFMRVQATYNGTDNIQADNYSGSRPGNIADQTVVAQVPGDFLPADEWTSNFRSTFTGGTALLQPAGVVKLLDMHTNSKIEPAQSIQCQFVWPADG